MIDVSQWRASIGLWNYCQAAPNRPDSHSFKATSREKTSRSRFKLLPAALSLIVFLVRYTKLNFIPPITVTVMIYLQSLVLFIATIGNSSDLIDLYLVLLLLLLSGDIELNPGPMIDDQPSCLLFAKCLKPLVDWKRFALCLPGITQSDVNIIEKAKRNAHLKKMALHKKWLQVNPQASWRDVVNALKQCKENELVKSIEHEMKWSGETDSNMEITISNRDATSTEPGRSNDNIETVTSGPVTGKLIHLIQHSLTDTLLQVI